MRLTFLAGIIAAGCSEESGPAPGPGDGGGDGDADGGGDGGVVVAGCGNGLVDGDDECERLVGCSDGERCTALCTCEPLPSSPPSSQDLIARALAAGTIDHPTSLTYRVWALFQAPELPEEYDGEGPTGEDTQLFFELSHVRGSLPVEVETAIAPYLVRPDDPTSVYSLPPFFVHGGQAGPPPVGCPLNGADPPVSDWRPSETEHFVVWSCGGGEGGTDALASKRLVAGEVAEDVWAEMVPSIRPPLADDYPIGPNPRGRIDIYLLEPNQCRMRAGRCIPMDGSSTGAAAFATPCGRVAGGPLTSSGYLLFGADRVDEVTPSPGTASAFRSTMAHELMHVITYGLNLEAQGGVCAPAPEGPGEGGESWLTEASGVWAEYSFFPTDDPQFRTRLFGGFQLLRDNSVVGLHSTAERHEYQAFLYPLFMQTETNGRDRFIELWTGSQGARTRRDLEDRLNSLFDFGEHFRDFSVRNFNRDLPGQPIEPHQTSDEALPFGGGYESTVLEPGVVLAAPTPALATPLRIAPLAQQTEHYTLLPSVRSFRIDARRVPNAGHLSLDAIVMDDSGTWHRKRPLGPVYEFCRDALGDDISELYVIFSNFDRSRLGAIEGEAQITTRTFCPGGWSGWFRFTQTLDEHSDDPQPAGTTVVDRHEREVQEWTVVDTRLVLPDGMPPGFEVETVDTYWTGDISVDNSSSFTSEDCGRSVSTESGGNAGPGTTAFAASGANGTYMLQSSEMADTFEVPIVYWNYPCDGPASTNPGQRQGAENYGYFLFFPQFTPLTEEPGDPGHFVGSGSYLHDVQERPGGQQILDLVLEWDLRRRPLE